MARSLRFCEPLWRIWKNKQGSIQPPRQLALCSRIEFYVPPLEKGVGHGSYWHTLHVRRFAQFRPLSAVHLPCVRGRQTGEV